MSRITSKSLDLARAISEFLTDYAPMHLTNSEHTLHSYETTITLYIGYLENECGIKPANFSLQSCNTRLSSFQKFIKYLSSRNPKYLYLLDEVSKVPLRKKTKKKVSGLSREAINLNFQ